MSHKQAQKNAGSKSGAKGSCSLQDRFREMGAQEQLIEQKKREIESKMQERKRKEQEEVLNKMQAKLMAAKKAEQSRASKLAGKRHGMFSRLQDVKKPRVATEQGSGKPASSAQTIANNFSNDGSFMEQFYKMQGIKISLKKKTSEEQEATKASEEQTLPVEVKQESNVFPSHCVAAIKSDTNNSGVTMSQALVSERRVSKFDVKPENADSYPVKTEGVDGPQPPLQPIMFVSQPAVQFSNPQQGAFTAISPSPNVAYAPSSFPGQHPPQDVVYTHQPGPTSVSFHQQGPPPPSFEQKLPAPSVVFAPQGAPPASVQFAPQCAPQTVTFTQQVAPPSSFIPPPQQQQIVLPVPPSGEFVQQGVPPNSQAFRPPAPQMGNYSQPPPGVALVSMAQPPPANASMLIVSHAPGPPQQITLLEAAPVSQVTTLHPMSTTLVLNAPPGPGQQTVAMPTASLVTVPNGAGPPPGAYTSAPGVLVTTVSMATVPPGQLPPQTVNVPTMLTAPPPVGTTLHNVSMQLQLPNLATAPPPQGLLTNPVPPQYALAPPPNLPPPPAANQTFLTGPPMPLSAPPPGQFQIPPPSSQQHLLPPPSLPPQLPPSQYPQGQLPPPTVSFPGSGSLIPPATPMGAHPSQVGVDHTVRQESGEKYDPMDPTEGYDPTNPTDAPEDGTSEDVSDVETRVRTRGKSSEGHGTEDTNLLSLQIGKKSNTSYLSGKSQMKLSGWQMSQVFDVPKANAQESAGVFPPEGSEVHGTIERLAKSVAEGGQEVEDTVRRQNHDNPAFRFLYDESSGFHKFYQQRLKELLEGHAARQQDEMEEAAADADGEDEQGDSELSRSEKRRKKRRSRWGPQEASGSAEGSTALPQMANVPLPTVVVNPQLGQPGVVVNPVLGGGVGQGFGIDIPGTGKTINITPLSQMQTPAFARQMTGGSELSDEHKRQIQEQQKMNAMFEYIQAKKNAMEAQAKALAAGLNVKPKYEYDSDEDIEGGTWEHKKRVMEMEATRDWAQKLTDMGRGKHHIGDFLPPDELERFMETFTALKEGREPDMSDYKQFKLTCENVGFKMLEKMGWKEGEGLGMEGQGIKQPVNKGILSLDGAGIGQERPANLTKEDDEFDAYRKRMMLAYRFRPNPLNNPRRAYY